MPNALSAPGHHVLQSSVGDRIRLRRCLRKLRIVATSKVELTELEVVVLLSITHDCHKSDAICAVERIGISVVLVPFCEL